MNKKKTQILVAFTFGIIFLVALIAWSILRPTPYPAQYAVFRTILALAAAGVAATVPGFINVELNTTKGLLIRAGGALAVFVIVFFFKPASLELQPTPDQPKVKKNDSSEVLKNKESKDTIEHSKPKSETYLSSDHKTDSISSEVISNVGLSWHSSADCKSYNWHDAKEYCENLKISTFENWRLPSQEELEKLLSKSDNSTIYSIFKCKNPPYDFWSSTFEKQSGNAFLIRLDKQYFHHRDLVKGQGYVCCVHSQ